MDVFFISKNKNNKAFSVAELSISIILIALLITSVFYGLKLIKNAAIISSRSYTQLSPVWNMLDEDGDMSVVFWLDILDTDSFTTETDNNIIKIKEWKSKVGGKAHSASYSDDLIPAANKLAPTPEYRINEAGTYPSIYFNGLGENDGSRLKLSFDPVSAGDQSFSFAFVYRPNVSSCHTPPGALYFQMGTLGPGAAWTTDAIEVDLLQFSSSDGSCRAAYHAGKNYAPVHPVSNDKAHPYYANRINSSIWVVDYNKVPEDRVIGYHNGVKYPSMIVGYSYNINGQNQNTFIHQNNNQSYLGGRHDKNYSYKGDLFEVIIFKSALSDKEARDVEAYLMSKYNIDKVN